MGVKQVILLGIVVTISLGLSSGMIYFGYSSLGNCKVEPSIPIWLMGE